MLAQLCSPPFFNRFERPKKETKMRRIWIKYDRCFLCKFRFLTWNINIVFFVLLTLENDNVEVDQNDVFREFGSK